MEKDMEVSKETKSGTTIGPAHLPLGCIPKGKEIIAPHKDSYPPMFIAAVCTTAKVGKHSHSCRLMDDKETRVLTQEHHSASKENKILTFATTRMGLEVSTLSEISQTQGEEH